MITEEVAINVRLNNGNLKESSDEATKSAGDLGGKLKAVNDTVAAGGLSFRQLSRQVQEYQSIALEAGRTSVIGKEALLKAASLKDELADLSSEVNSLSQDGQKLQGALQLGSTIIAGYTAFKGVTALLGVENENLQKTFVKLQAAQGLLMSVEQIRLALEKESQLRIQASIVLDKLKAASTATLATVVGTATGAMKLFRLALAATGIGAIVVGIGLLIANFDTVKNAVGNAIEKFRGLGSAVKVLFAPITGLIALFDGVVFVLEKVGLIDDENTKNLKKNAASRIETAKNERDKAVDNIDFEIAKRKAAGEETKKLEKEKRMLILTSINEEIQAIQQLAKLNGEISEEQNTRLEELRKLFLETSRQNEIARIEEEKLAKESEEKKLEIQKEAAAKRAAEREKENQLKLEREQVLNELILANIKDADDRELAILLDKQMKEREALTAKFGQDTELEKKLKTKQKSELDAFNKQVEEKKAEEELAKKEAKNEERKKELELELLRLDEDDALFSKKKIELLKKNAAIESDNNKLAATDKLIIAEKLKDDIAAVQDEAVEKEKQQKEAIANLEQKLLDARFQAANAISGLVGTQSKFGKALALSIIATETAIAFVNGLRIAQQTASAAGPGAAFALPIFFAQQVAIISSVVAKAKGMLGSSGGISPPTFSAPSVSTGPGSGGGGSSVQPTNVNNFNPNNESTQIKVVVLDSDIQEVGKRVNNNNNFARVV